MKDIQCLLRNYTGANGNSIEAPEISSPNIRIEFSGKRNRLQVSPDAELSYLKVFFDSDDAILKIGKSTIKLYARLGLKGRIIIGSGVTSTSHVYMTVAEMSQITIGDDCMFALGNEIRADDSHPIFDVRTGLRVNIPEDIYIGQHVWLAQHAAVLSGSSIKDGSVIGFRSIVKGAIPNNVIAAGAPAKVIKKDIAWERPRLSLAKPDIVSSCKSSQYWEHTEEDSI